MKSFTAQATPCELILASTLSERTKSCFSLAAKLSIFLKHGRFLWLLAKCSAKSQPFNAMRVNSAKWSNCEVAQLTDGISVVLAIVLSIELFVSTPTNNWFVGFEIFDILAQ
jgi:hypothetical protein